MTLQSKSIPATLVSLAMWGAGCTYGTVRDIQASDTSNAYIGGATISFRQPDLSYPVAYDVVDFLGAARIVNTWSASKSWPDGPHGTYYLNQMGKSADGDDHATYAGSGWTRVKTSKPGYDTRLEYHNILYGESCDIFEKQGAYSAGPYPYVSSGATIAGSCESIHIDLEANTTNYVKTPDMIVDPRLLNDYQIGTTRAACDDLANRCLRVSVGTPNVGNGDLWLLGQKGTSGVTQRRFRRNSGTVDNALANAVFLFHPTHNHIHLQNWTALRLRKFTSACDSESTATRCPLVGVPGAKISYCLTENATFDSGYTPNRSYSECEADSSGKISQGIGSGEEDVYGKSTPGQLIGIEGLAPGKYWLEVEVNPANSKGQRTVIESDTSNNISRVVVKL